MGYLGNQGTQSLKSFLFDFLDFWATKYLIFSDLRGQGVHFLTIFSILGAWEPLLEAWGTF